MHTWTQTFIYHILLPIKVFAKEEETPLILFFGFGGRYFSYYSSSEPSDMVRTCVEDVGLSPLL